MAKTRDKLLKERWNYADKKLKEANKMIRDEYKTLSENVFDELNILQISKDNLSQKVPERFKKKVKDAMKKYDRKDNYYIFYLFLTMSYTYRKVAEFLIYDHYCDTFKNIKSISKNTLFSIAKDSYSQAERELGVSGKGLSNKTIENMMMLPSLGQTFNEYLDTESITQSQKVTEYIFSVTMIDENGITEELLNKKFTKEANRIIKVTDNKYSGTLDDEARIVANESYLALGKEKEDVQARFIAELDDHTTKMCKSLDLQIFNVNDWNEFYRWSDLNQDYVKVKIFGLEVGINLPPISDHFHWCRSTITYDTSYEGLLEAKEANHFIEKRRKELNK